MGIHFQVSGTGLKSLFPDVGGVYALLGKIIALDGKVTRLDVALDAIDSGLSISELQLLIDDPQTVKSSSKHLAIASQGGGQTLYVGSRQSERYLRIYNKAAERLAAGADNSLSSDWIRIELEVKGEKAKALADTLASSITPPDETIRQWIVAFIDFKEHAIWQAVMGQEGARMAISHRKLTNSRKWLLGTVARAIAKELMKQDGFRVEFEAALEKAIDDEIETAKAGFEDTGARVTIMLGSWEYE
jgi:hypothetical protein